MNAAEKRWLRDTMRKIIREEIQTAIESISIQQVGGFDGATFVFDDDPTSGKTARPVIGFQTSNRVSE